MEFKTYEGLPKEAKEIRTEVFVNEQGFKEEFDSLDNYATHVLVFDGDRAIATCRFFVEQDYYLIGRIAVVKDYRKMGVGAKMLEFAVGEIKALGVEEIRLHSQKCAEEFYKKQGFESYGEIDYDEGREHIWMKKKLI